MKFNILFLCGLYFMQVILWNGCETANRNIDINVAMMKSLEQFHNGAKRTDIPAKQPWNASPKSQRDFAGILPQNTPEKSKNGEAYKGDLNNRTKTFKMDTTSTEKIPKKGPKIRLCDVPPLIPSKVPILNGAVNGSRSKKTLRKDVPMEKNQREKGRIKLNEVPPLNPVYVPPKYEYLPPEKPLSKEWDSSKYPRDPETGEQIVYTPKKLKNSGRRNPPFPPLPSPKLIQKKTSTKKVIPEIVNNSKSNSFREKLQNQVDKYFPKDENKYLEKINVAKSQNMKKEETSSTVTQDEISLSGSVPLSDSSRSRNQILKSGTNKNFRKILEKYPSSNGSTNQNQNNEIYQNNIGNGEFFEPEFSSSVGSSRSVQKYSSESVESILRQDTEISAKKRNAFLQNNQNKKSIPRQKTQIREKSVPPKTDQATPSSMAKNSNSNPNKKCETPTKGQSLNDRIPNSDDRKQNSDYKKQNVDETKPANNDKEMAEFFAGRRALAYLNMKFVTMSGRYLVKHGKGMILVQENGRIELPIFNESKMVKNIQFHGNGIPQLSERSIEVLYSNTKSQPYHWAINILSFVNIRFVLKNYNWRTFCKIMSHAISLKTHGCTYYTTDEEQENRFYQSPTNEYKLRPVTFTSIHQVVPSDEIVTPCPMEEACETNGKLEIHREIFYLSPGAEPGYFFVYMDFIPSTKPTVANSIVVVDHLKLSKEGWDQLK